MRKKANYIIHRILVDNGSVVDILYRDAYQNTRLTESDLSLMTSLLYRFTRDHVIPRGTIKLAITVGDHPQTSTVVTEFLAVDSSSAFNGMIGRLFYKDLRAVVTS